MNIYYQYDSTGNITSKLETRGVISATNMFKVKSGIDPSHIKVGMKFDKLTKSISPAPVVGEDLMSEPVDISSDIEG